MDDGNDEIKLLDGIVRKRFEVTKLERNNSRQKISKSEPLKAEPDLTRALKYASKKQLGPEALQGDSIDYLPSWFLKAGASRARSVARLTVGGSSIGTGFLISPELLITNNHVLSDPGVAGKFSAEFNYENGEGELPEQPTIFALNANAFWLTDTVDQLDFTIIALGDKLRGALEPKDLGYLPLSARPDKHALGMCVNIIQHPMGRRKQVVVRENRLLARGVEGSLAERTLHYSADTEEGTSGSPVFNDNWEVVALHHWGVPHLDTITVDGVPIPQTVNEGIRISSIVAQLQVNLAVLDAPKKAMLQRALALGEGAMPSQSIPTKPESRSEAISLSKTTTGGAPMPSKPGEVVQVVNVPLEIRVSLATGGVVGASWMPPTSASFSEKIVIDRDYTNRNGYAATFIDGLELPLADVVGPRLGEVAPLKNGSSRADAVLDYENFSLMLCKARRMAFCTATNIDAESYVEIDRDTGLPRVGPEGESWFDDDRVDKAYFIAQSFYSEWSIYFDRGHLTRRTDPTWGENAVRANADTYHRTNCTPQHFRFNQSTKYWQGAEQYILEHGALAANRKATVFTGPVLDDAWKEYGDIQVPMRFWKVIVWIGDQGTIESTALLLSQETLLKEKRVPLGFSAAPSDEQIDTFRVSVKHLSQLTGLDFSALEQYDTYRVPESVGGAEAIPVRVLAGWEDLM